MNEPTDELTFRQRDIFDFIVDYARDFGCSPTVREIGDRFGITSPNGVQCHLRAMIRKGVIRRRENCARGIEIVNGKYCPCCGQPIKANEDPADIAANLAADGT